jgi:hypothetical protein
MLLVAVIDSRNNNSGTGSRLAEYNLPSAGQRSPQFQSRNCVYSSRLKMRPYLYPKLPHFGHNPIENQTLVPENHPFRARPQRAPSACTSGMKPHSYPPHQNYTTASTHYVIPSAAKNLHGTTFTFVMKRLQVPCRFGGDRLCFCHEIAPAHPSLEGTACTFGAKLHQVTGARQQSSARTDLGRAARSA